MRKRKFYQIDFYGNIALKSGMDILSDMTRMFKSEFVDAVYNFLYDHYVTNLSNPSSIYLLNPIHEDNIEKLIKYYEDYEMYEKCSILLSSYKNRNTTTDIVEGITKE